MFRYKSIELLADYLENGLNLEKLTFL